MWGWAGTSRQRVAGRLFGRVTGHAVRRPALCPTDIALWRHALGFASVCALALSLLFTQFLAQTHRFAHSQAAANPQGQASGSDQSDTWHEAHAHVLADARAGVQVPAAQEAFAHLFSGHGEDSAECRALDQLSHFDAIPGVALLALPLVIQPFVLSVLPGLAVARWHALFQARGPPSLR